MSQMRREVKEFFERAKEHGIKSMHDDLDLFLEEVWEDGYKAGHKEGYYYGWDKMLVEMQTGSWRNRE